VRVSDGCHNMSRACKDRLIIVRIAKGDKRLFTENALMGGVLYRSFFGAPFGMDLEFQITSKPPTHVCTQHSNAIKTISLLLQKAQQVHCSVSKPWR
jgi:hypothetical protein